MEMSQAESSKKGMLILKMIKLMAQSMRRMKFLKIRFFHISKKARTLKIRFLPISRKVRTLPYIHHIKPVNCFIFLKF